MSTFDLARRRDYRVLDRRSEMGRSRVFIECPFCKGRFWAYVWSLAGSGKKCPHCEAFHGSMAAYPPC